MNIQTKADALEFVKRIGHFQNDNNLITDFILGIGKIRRENLKPFLKFSDLILELSEMLDGSFNILLGSSFGTITSNDINIIINDINYGNYDRFF
jgi:hypothetical protein